MTLTKQKASINNVTKKVKQILSINIISHIV